MKNYPTQVVKNYPTIVESLSKLCRIIKANLTRKKVNFKWTELCQENFEKLKKCLINPPILNYPDFSKEFVLHVHKR